jgi:predicted RNase H-like nuclease (RuvC/YqgF family)
MHAFVDLFCFFLQGHGAGPSNTVALRENAGQANFKYLQQLERSRDRNIKEIALRDQANERLKRENERLKQEVAQLKLQIARLKLQTAPRPQVARPNPQVAQGVPQRQRRPGCLRPSQDPRLHY